ncbi:MAG: TetR family transcriptional regulator [Acidimicrobiia bacterium]
MTGRAARTKDRLQEEALRLFTERGFDAVTVDEVAAAAGVSHMTFFRHFPTKEDVVLEDPYDPVVGEVIAEIDPALPAMRRVCLGLERAYAALPEPADDTVRQRVLLAAGHRGLRARVWENNQVTGNVIADALVGGGTDPFEARVVAGAVLGAITAALFDWADDDSRSSLGDRLRVALSTLSQETGR